MTDPRVPVTPGNPETVDPAVSPPTTPPVDLPSAGPGPDKSDIPSGNEVLSGEDGIACVQDFLSHLFGGEFESFRQAWQIKKG
jgi:hypothetical protein